jgi:NAD(P)-dependent dehydrogenase (short-subunit alcohol dehydrogenase family)
VVNEPGGELDGRVAIVTGGASGVGRGTVQRFVAAGARVVIADVEADRGEELAAALGLDAVFRRADVSDPGQVGTLVADAVEKFGGLHIMVNSAGISDTTHRKLIDDDLAEFRNVMAFNVLGVMAGTRDAARHMAAHGGGSIVNVTPMGGSAMTNRASKAAVIQFTKSAAIELACYEIRVNAVTPDDGAAANFNDIAEAALYFAGDRSRYVTGTVLPVGGGAVAG